MTRCALDTSVAVPYLMVSHTAHGDARRAVAGADAVLTGHSLAETYSVLTRLPGDARLTAADAARLIGSNFGPPVLLPERLGGDLPNVLARSGVAGGQVYDALVALSAQEAELRLVTRDQRAAATYVALAVHHDLVT